MHAAIQVAGVHNELPAYVPRDVDEQLRALLRAGIAERGCFVLLIGDSSVGKTRTAYEAVRAEGGSWWLFHPGDAGRLQAFAEAPIRKTVVWLDEIQRYLVGGLDAGVIRALRASRDPLLIVGTLWPELYHRYNSMPRADGDGPYARHRELLGLATILTVDPVLSGPERQRAHDIATHDARLAQSLDSAYGMTQALAAAPELVRRWDTAPTRYAWAVITAAVDTRRIGVHSPLSADFLRAAAPGYLTGTERGKAPANWFETALAYATEEIHGAASALAPEAAEIGVISGYLAADYLLQHGTRTRAAEIPPDSAWVAYQHHLATTADKFHAATAAHRLGRLTTAEHLYRAAISERMARINLAELLPKMGRRSEVEQIWRDAVAAGERDARTTLAGWLQESFRGPEAEQVWRDAVAAGEYGAQSSLAGLLQELGRGPEAEQVWRDAVAAGEYGARLRLAGLLQDLGRGTEVEQVWRDAVAAGEENAQSTLADLLQDLGRGPEAEQVWRDAVAADEAGARSGLARLLRELGRGREAEKVSRDAVAADDYGARPMLASVLQELGRGTEAEQVWRDALAAGEEGARIGLGALLRDLGRGPEAEQVWRDAVAADEYGAEAMLTRLLQELGRGTEVKRGEGDTPRAE